MDFVVMLLRVRLFWEDAQDLNCCDAGEVWIQFWQETNLTTVTRMQHVAQITRYAFSLRAQSIAIAARRGAVTPVTPVTPPTERTSASRVAHARVRVSSSA